MKRKKSSSPETLNRTNAESTEKKEEKSIPFYCLFLKIANGLLMSNTLNLGLGAFFNLRYSKVKSWVDILNLAITVIIMYLLIRLMVLDLYLPFNWDFIKKFFKTPKPNTNQNQGISPPPNTSNDEIAIGINPQMPQHSSSAQGPAPSNLPQGNSLVESGLKSNEDRKENPSESQTRVQHENNKENSQKDIHESTQQNRGNLPEGPQNQKPSNNQGQASGSHPSHDPLPIIRVLPPPPEAPHVNLQISQVPQQPNIQARQSDNHPPAPEAQSNLIEVRPASRIGNIFRVVFLIPIINEQNGKYQKDILKNIFQDYSYGTFCSKVYGFMGALKYLFFSFFMVFCYTVPLFPLIGFTILCIFTLISALFFNVFAKKWSKVQSIISDLLMILFNIALITLILYSEPTKECEEQRMLMGFILLFVNYLFYLLFFVNIIAMVIEIVHNTYLKRKKERARQQEEEQRLHPP